MNKSLYSAIEEEFSDAYCEGGKLDVAKLYADIQTLTDRLLRDYMTLEEDSDEEN